MVARFIAISGLIMALLAGGLPAEAQQVERRVETTKDGDYFGFDLRAERDVTLEDCEKLCIADSQCRAFTYNTKAAWCFLKSDFGELKTFAGAVAGKIVEVAAEPDIGPAPALDFFRGSELANAANYLRDAKLAAKRESLAGPLELLDQATTSLSTGNTSKGGSELKAAVGNDPENVAVWLGAARVVLRYMRANSGGDWYMRQDGLSAAINGYKLTRTASLRAEALALIAAMLDIQDENRPALTAYKKSLEIVNSPQVLAAYQTLRASDGFRVIGNTVDTESSRPRICVQFSEPLLKSGVDYGDYIAVDGKSGTAVEAGERQVCVTGLEHGETYRVTVRAGLPSTVDEVLEEPTVLNSYIRDRQPVVRFTGDNFVLPSQMRQGIPLIGVNTTRANLELYRIGDRALADTITGNDFLTQLGGYTVERVRDDFGQAIWKGELDLAMERNKEVTTSFPIGDILEKREPGIYVLTATTVEGESEYWSPRATQWFLVSDIGLTTYAGGDGLTVSTRSFDDATAKQGVALSLIARNNEVLGTATSDAQGMAHFEPGLMRGTGGRTPVLLTARLAGSGGNDDFVFLDLTRAGFDLSDRGVDGRSAPGPVDLFTWTDRGIYRPGETIHAMTLARDDTSTALDGLPLTLILTRPDGVEAQRIVSTQPSQGGHFTDFAIPSNAMRGAWQLAAYTDPERAPITSMNLLVEDFIPDRIEFDLTAKDEALLPGEPSTLEVDGRFLYGAPADGLALEGEMRITSERGLDAAPGFYFGLDDEDASLSTQVTLSNLAETDSAGLASFDVEAEQVPASTRPLVAEITIRMREDGGRFVERSISLPVVQDKTRIGIRPEFEDGVGEDSNANFRLLALDGQGEKIGLSGLKWSLYRLERNYQWYRDGYYWRYEATTDPRLISNGEIDIDAANGAAISTPVEWGRYRLEVESADPSGPASSYAFDAGWYSAGDPSETPDALEIALDKESYRAGETAKLKISPRFAGQAMVSIGGDRYLETIDASIPAEGGEIEIPVKKEWGAGVYVTTTLYRPGSANETRMPMRAIGTAWLTVEPEERELAVSLDLPEKARPNELLTVPVSVTGGVPGESIFATVAVVDVGILNLTGYEAPDPGDWYFGQRQLGLEIRDIYGRLIDGSAGDFGRVRTGGDGASMSAQGSPPKEKLLALFSGIVELGVDGTANIDFDIPQFNGTGRVMAVAWSKSSVGSASADVIIRDPVVITATLPKVLAPGDVAQTILEIANTDGPAGAYELSIASGDGITIGDVPPTVELAAGERKVLKLPLNANASGQADVTFTASLGTDVLVTRTQETRVRPATEPVATKMEIPLAANGGSINVDGELLAQSYPQGATVSVNVSKTAGFDVPSLLMKLDRYPYGCAEQTTSRALPLLYLSDLDAPKELLDTPDLEKRINGAIERVLSYQASSGSFGLWGPGDTDFWLDAYVTDFLTRAKEKNYAVPEQSLRLALGNLQNKLGYKNDVEDDGDAMAYALYVLARNRMASASDLRYYADTKIDEFETPLARAQIGAALSLYNDIERANNAFASAFEKASEPDDEKYFRSDYGTTLRDGAAILTLASESRPVAPIVPGMIDMVEDILQQKRYSSTQENAWMLLATRAAQEGNKTLKLEVNGRPREGAYTASIDGESLIANPVKVVNNGPEPVTAVVTALASPIQPLPAGGNGFDINREYYHLDGTPAQMIEVDQNDRFVVVLTVDELNDLSGQVLVTDLLPGGFEIENPSIVDSASLENFDWLGETDAAHSEFRDDRFVAAFDRSGSEERQFTTAYLVRAVTPGRYTHPAASVEDMYRPEYSARTATGFIEIKAAQ